MSKKNALIKTIAFALAGITSAWAIAAKDVQAVTPFHPGEDGSTVTIAQKSDPYEAIRAAEGITKENGWDCYSAQEMESKNPAVFNMLTSTSLGNSALAIMEGHGTKNCVAPIHIYNTKYPDGSKATYSHRMNAIVGSYDNQLSTYGMHEIIHAGQDFKTDNLSRQLDALSKDTAYIQTILLQEAGSLTAEIIQAFLEKAAGFPESYNRFASDNNGSLRKSLAAVVENLIKTDTAVANYFDNPQGDPPAHLLDTCASTVLTDGNILYPWLNGETKQTAEFYKQKPGMLASADFKPISLSGDLLGDVLFGELSWAKNEYPKTQMAFDLLGKELAPHLKALYSGNLSDEQIAEATKKFTATLGPPQPYDAPSKPGPVQVGNASFPVSTL